MRYFLGRPVTFGNKAVYEFGGKLFNPISGRNLRDKFLDNFLEKFSPFFGFGYIFSNIINYGIYISIQLDIGIGYPAQYKKRIVLVKNTIVSSFIEQLEVRVNASGEKRVFVKFLWEMKAIDFLFKFRPFKIGYYSGTILNVPTISKIISITIFIFLYIVDYN